MLGALHALSPVPLISPEAFSYRLLLVLAGGDEQLASQPRPQEGTVDKVIVKKHADIGEVVLDVPPRQGLRERRYARMVFKGQAIFFPLNDNDTEKRSLPMALAFLPHVVIRKSHSSQALVIWALSEVAL